MNKLWLSILSIFIAFVSLGHIAYKQGYNDGEKRSNLSADLEAQKNLIGRIRWYKGYNDAKEVCRKKSDGTVIFSETFFQCERLKNASK